MHPPIPRYPMTKFAVGNMLRHRKTGGLYELLYFALMEKTLEPMVVYRALTTAEDEPREVWIRPLAEMQDGRFELVPRPAPQHL